MKKQVKKVIDELDAEIAKLTGQRKAAEELRLAALDFDDKNYYNGIEQGIENSIKYIKKAKKIVIKHLKT